MCVPRGSKYLINYGYKCSLFRLGGFALRLNFGYLACEKDGKFHRLDKEYTYNNSHRSAKRAIRSRSYRKVPWYIRKFPEFYPSCMTMTMTGEGRIFGAGKGTKASDIMHRLNILAADK